MKIEALYSDGGDELLFYYARGHWPIADFLAALPDYIRSEFGRDDVMIAEEMERLSGEPFHDWMRAVPAPRDAECRTWYVDAKPNSRGAFPVTRTMDAW